MIMNYVLSFCKITAASKIFSRNFYLPLLKPLTPKDAARTFKITGKWLLGSKRQHYMPVLHNHKKKRSKKCKNYGKLSHEIEYDYTYMTPVLDPENESHQLLMNLLDKKNGDGMFIYQVEDKKYNLVFAATLELAIRDGDVIDVLVSQRNDKIIVKLRDFKKIPMEIDYYVGEDDLYRGEGATTVEEERNHHHGKYTMSLAKIFEEKERLSEEWEAKLNHIIKKRRKQAGEDTIEWNEMVQDGINKLDWSKFEREAKKVVEQIGDSIPERHIEMEVEDFELTKYVAEVLMKNGPQMLDRLPTMKEITDVVKSMPTATPHEIEADLEEEEEVDEELKPKPKRRVSGVVVTLPSGKECFVTGQMVRTDDGEVFVPGQTVQNEFGTEYAPGITINMDNKPTLITGLIMAEEEREPMFLPTESSITKDGQLTFAMTQQERPKLPPERFRSKFKKAKQNQINGEIKVEEPQVITAEIVEEIPHQVEEEPVKLKKKTKKRREKEKILVIEEEQKEDEIKTPEVDVNEEKKENEVEEVVTIKQEREALDEEDEQQRANIERLQLRPIDDGMDELIANLQDKTLKLQQKLEELRKLTINMEDTSITYVNNDDAMEVAHKVSEEKEFAEKFTEVLLTLTRRAAAFRDKNSVNIKNIHNSYFLYNNAIINEADEKFDSCSHNLKILLKTAVVTANDVFKTRPKDQLLALQAIGDILCDTLKLNIKLRNEILNLMNTSVERNEICTAIFRQLTQDVVENKMDALKAAINGTPDVSEKILQVLEKEGDILGPAITKLFKTYPELLSLVLTKVKKNIDDVTNDNKAMHLLQTAIVNSIKETSEENLSKLVNENKNNEIKEFLKEAISFSIALGINSGVEDLMEMEMENKINLMDCKKATLELLKRVTVIRQLAERDYSLKTAIERIKKKPECGKSDPRIRQLVRESASLISDLPPIRSSREIPLALMKAQNHLAIEDFLIQRSRIDYPILVSRNGLQAVIPKEAARSVLAGRVSYVLIDESGLTNFKPVHMFSALKLGKTREKRFEDYPCIGGHVPNEDYEPKTMAHRNVRKMKKILNNRRQNA